MALGNEFLPQHLKLHLLILHWALACITVGCCLLCLIEIYKWKYTFPEDLIWLLSVGTLHCLNFLKSHLQFVKEQMNILCCLQFNVCGCFNSFCSCTYTGIGWILGGCKGVLDSFQHNSQVRLHAKVQSINFPCWLQVQYEQQTVLVGSSRLCPADRNTSWLLKSIKRSAIEVVSKAWVEN